MLSLSPLAVDADINLDAHDLFDADRDVVEPVDDDDEDDTTKALYAGVRVTLLDLDTVL